MLNANDLIQSIHQNIQNVIVGKDEAIDQIITALICRGHVLIEDVPGVGKTMMVSSLARSLNCSFQRIQFTPDVLPSDITGFSMVNFKTGEMEFHEGQIMRQIILADEINRTSPKTQSSLLEVMEERQVTVDGLTRKLPEPFMVLATQNPIEYVGTFPLPEAQLDRFFMRISIGYPSVQEEMNILRRFTQDSPLQQLQAVAEAQDILTLQDQVKSVHCSAELQEYVVRIANATRSNESLLLGASPRGALSLMRAAQGTALIAGRDYVLPEDVQRMVQPVLAHRLVLRPEAKLKGLTAERALKSVLNSLMVPVISK